MSVLQYSVCPTDCAGSLPEPKFNPCAPQVGWGEFETLYLGKPGTAPFANVEDLSEWTTRLALPISDDDAIRAFTIKGELPAAEANEVVIAGNTIVRGLKKFNIPFQIHEDTDENYEAHLLFECYPEFVAWVATADGMMLGGNDGIQKVSVITDYIVPVDRTAIRYYAGKASWNNKKSPLRSINPNA